MASQIWGKDWEDKFRHLAENLYPKNDASHDFFHVERVVSLCSMLSQSEGGDIDVIMPAAWLHDVITANKSSLEKRKEASSESALLAESILIDLNYPDEGRFAQITHAIESHSFSANIMPNTLEAKIVQDGDRLDAIGATGLLRMAIVAGRLGTPHLYHPSDIIASHREADDRKYVLDHIWKKLFRLPSMLHTVSAKKEAEKRIALMELFVLNIEEEVGLVKQA
jgi:uncharacterized protein